ncbi:hypothetical protein J5N97_025742 [Dioscorea zingiberensis]|uniref:Peptidase M24 domain-containing protein n=1 Tax=Dioscorea zingiberensis TaxID=325984 RepID=A0A9D5C1C4_9LILI|nr:hypothetical protein J5N97_025742 [Dioscorea zingiberensis]
MAATFSQSTVAPKAGTDRGKLPLRIQQRSEDEPPMGTNRSITQLITSLDQDLDPRRKGSTHIPDLQMSNHNQLVDRIMMAIEAKSDHAVLKAHNAVISEMRPGISWIDMHKLAEKNILESLHKESILVGNIDDMMSKRLGATYDMMSNFLYYFSLTYNGKERPKEPGLMSLRTVRELKEGMVITVEPGCYFIDALLSPASEASDTSGFFNQKELVKYKDFGGVRIESDVVWPSLS